MKKLVWILVLSITGCAGWYTPPEELAEMKERRKQGISEHCYVDVESLSLKCKEVAPDDCKKIENGIYVCGKAAEKFRP